MIRIVAGDPGIDALIVIFIPPLVTRAEDVAQAIIDNARELTKTKPILAVCMTARGIADQLRTAEVRVPSFDFPEPAAITLAHVTRYAEWRSRPLTTPPRARGHRARRGSGGSGNGASPRRGMADARGDPVCAYLLRHPVHRTTGG